MEDRCCSGVYAHQGGIAADGEERMEPSAQIAGGSRFGRPVRQLEYEDVPHIERRALLGRY